MEWPQGAGELAMTSKLRDILPCAIMRTSQNDRLQDMVNTEE
jgi:hypothetical protein